MVRILLRKSCFLEDVKDEIKANDNEIKYIVRDKLKLLLNSLINKIEEDRERLSKIKKHKNLPKDQRNDIENFLDEQMIAQTDKKNKLIDMRKRLFEERSEPIDIEKELKSVFSNLDIANE